MKAWSDVPPPIPAPRAAPTFDAAARRNAPPLERLVGVWLDAATAARGAVPLPSAILIEGDRWFATDPEYPGGYMAETTPGGLVRWSAEVEQDLCRIAAWVTEQAGMEVGRRRARVRQAAEHVATALLAKCTGPDGAEVLYDIGRCAEGELLVPCRRAKDYPAILVELTGNTSIVPSRWTARWPVAETEPNRRLLGPFAFRVRRALTTAERLGWHLATRTGEAAVHALLDSRDGPDPRQAPREHEVGTQLEPRDR